MQPFEAIKMAREKGLDLVEISPTADPPVCKITGLRQVPLSGEQEGA